jgi:hypothetical protein
MPNLIPLRWIPAPLDPRPAARPRTTARHRRAQRALPIMVMPFHRAALLAFLSLLGLQTAAGGAARGNVVVLKVRVGELHSNGLHVLGKLQAAPTLVVAGRACMEPPRHLPSPLPVCLGTPDTSCACRMRTSTSTWTTTRGWWTVSCRRSAGGPTTVVPHFCSTLPSPISPICPSPSPICHTRPAGRPGWTKVGAWLVDGEEGEGGRVRRGSG